MNEDDEGYGSDVEVPRMEGIGHVHMNGSAKIVSWILGIFGALITVLLSLVLTAVYNTNGDVREMKGEMAALAREVAQMRPHGQP